MKKSNFTVLKNQKFIVDLKLLEIRKDLNIIYNKKFFNKLK
jgi:hypothetical protein